MRRKSILQDFDDGSHLRASAVAHGFQTQQCPPSHLSQSLEKDLLIHINIYGDSVVKNPPANSGDTGSIPESGRSPGEGNGNSFQYSCLGNPVDGGAWWATVHGVAQSWTWLSDKESTCQLMKRTLDPWVGKISWRRKWQLVPIFLPGKSHGQRSLAGYSPWGGKRIRHDSVNKTTK